MRLPARIVVSCVVVLTSVIPKVQADERFSLRERAKTGQSFRADLRLSADGVRPTAKDDAPAQPRGTIGPEKGSSAQLPFRVTAHAAWQERIAGVDEAERTTRLLRRVETAEASIDFFRGQGQTLTARLRPELSLLVVEPTGNEVVVFSAGGPLTRDELDLLQGPGDSLLLPRVLPDKPVTVGEGWDLPPAVALSWSEYALLASSTLRASLKSCDANVARIDISGVVKGSMHDGGVGTITFQGVAQFDRKTACMTALQLDRTEVRKKGLIETALDVKSRIDLSRAPIDTPPELSDAALAGLPLEITPQSLLLRTDAPGGQYTVMHDRNWFTRRDDERLVELVRLDARGAPIAQCDLIIAPNAGTGRHQDVNQFRDDVRKSLGKKFGRILGEGELNDTALPGFRYKLSIEGAEQEAALVPLWYYYLVASPSGEQLVAIFTLSRGTEAVFGDQDLALIGSLVWKSAAGQPTR